MDNPYYKKLITHNSKDINAVAERWNILSNNLKKGRTGLPVILPDMLWSVRSGAGKTHLLELISEYLFIQENLMEFEGDVKFFEFLVDYTPHGEDFTELCRLIDEINSAAGFRNAYKGIISVDISEWVGHIYEKNFLTLLEFLSAGSDSWLIIFTVPAAKENEIIELERLLSMFFRMEKVTLELPATGELYNFFLNLLGAYGIKVSKESEKILRESIDILRENEFFDGYKTVKIFCQDMIYRLFTSGNASGNEMSDTINADLAAQFSAESSYIKRTLHKIQSKNTLGFK